MVQWIEKQKTVLIFDYDFIFFKKIVQLCTYTREHIVEFKIIYFIVTICLIGLTRLSSFDNEDFVIHYNLADTKASSSFYPKIDFFLYMIH